RRAKRIERLCPNHDHAATNGSRLPARINQPEDASHAQHARQAADGLEWHVQRHAASAAATNATNASRSQAQKTNGPDDRKAAGTKQDPRTDSASAHARGQGRAAKESEV